MFLCFPVSTINLQSCLFPQHITPNITNLVSKAQSLRNELCTQRENAECGLARLYHDALSECVKHIPNHGRAQSFLMSQWCVGASDWIVTLSGVRAELSLSLLASVYWCFNAKKPVSSTTYAAALETLRMLVDCLDSWMNLPKPRPLVDFELMNLNIVRVYCHAALNVEASKDIEVINNDREVLKVKAQFARHAYELLAPIISIKKSTNPRQQHLLNLCVSLQHEALAECFYSSALVEKENEKYDTALCILEKGTKLMGDSNPQRAQLDVLLRNVKDLKTVFSKEGLSIKSFDWSMIPCCECVMFPNTCAEHSESFVRKL